ncbi:hypothetical protein MSAN_00535900 [Mycena sanguinolenta]|uniref:Uncharacterized protein n=1 Tax=Mycena sanguinolenta TaxID=230812 RepID=A0A8H7DG98_9AGAR|nr:hypothetical protein MSAN_00535900 [Mycena sanguinolenta]
MPDFPTPKCSPSNKHRSRRDGVPFDALKAPPPPANAALHPLHRVPSAASMRPASPPSLGFLHTNGPRLRLATHALRPPHSPASPRQPCLPFVSLDRRLAALS